MAVVVQELVPAEVAGVLFTRNPVTGAAERVIEASWGLGEAVVAGLVVPDRFRLDVRGRVLERTMGEKDVALRIGPAGTREVAVDAPDVHAPCLDDDAARRAARPRGSLRRASTAPESTTSSSRSTAAPCSCCSGGRSPVGEDAGRAAGSGRPCSPPSLLPLNSTMIAVALPEIAREFGHSPGTAAQAVVASYLVAAIVLQSPGGKLGDRLGHWRHAGARAGADQRAGRCWACSPERWPCSRWPG